MPTKYFVSVSVPGQINVWIGSCVPYFLAKNVLAQRALLCVLFVQLDGYVFTFCLPLITNLIANLITNSITNPFSRQSTLSPPWSLSTISQFEQ